MAGVAVQTDAIIKHDVGITVSVPCDACTQTPINAEVQTDLCMHHLTVSCVSVKNKVMTVRFFTDPPIRIIVWFQEKTNTDKY